MHFSFNMPALDYQEVFCGIPVFVTFIHILKMVWKINNPANSFYTSTRRKKINLSSYDTLRCSSILYYENCAASNYYKWDSSWTWWRAIGKHCCVTFLLWWTEIYIPCVTWLTLDFHMGHLKKGKKKKPYFLFWYYFLNGVDGFIYNLNCFGNE